MRTGVTVSKQGGSSSFSAVGGGAGVSDGLRGQCSAAVVAGDGYETLVHHPTMLWPDTLSVAADGYLYITCNQLHRQPKFHGGEDLREKPYVLIRTRVDAEPVRLK